MLDYHVNDEVEFKDSYSKDCNVIRGIIRRVNALRAFIEDEQGKTHFVGVDRIIKTLPPYTVTINKPEETNVYAIAYLLKDNKNGNHSVIMQNVAATDHAAAVHYAEKSIQESNANNVADQTWLNATVELVDIVRHIEQKNDNKFPTAYRVELRRA